MWKNSTTITKQDYVFLNQNTVKIIYALLGVGAIGVVCSIFFIILNSLYWFLMVGFLTLIFCGLFCIFLLVKSSKTAIGQCLEYEFLENGFTVTTQNGTCNLSYDSIINVKQNSKTLLLYLSKTQAYIVDKTNLPCEFLTFIEGKIVRF